jgi:transposase
VSLGNLNQGARKSIDLVQMRDVLEELAKRKGSDALLEVVMGVLLKAEEAIEAQAVEIQFLRKQLFGRRSEKLSPNQLSLFAIMLGTVVGTEPSAETEPSQEKKPKKKRKKAARRPLVPTQTHEIPIPEEERPCPQCGKARCTLGHVRTLVIEYTPPKIEVIEYLREKIVCRPV